MAIVDDDGVLRDNLRLLVDTTPGFACPEVFADRDDALTRLQPGSVDVLLLDVEMPGRSGPEGIEDLKARCPGAEVVMFTVYADENKVFESRCRGASGYLLKHTSPERRVVIYEGSPWRTLGWGPPRGQKKGVPPPGPPGSAAAGEHGTSSRSDRPPRASG